MITIPGWSQDNNIIITDLIKGYDELDDVQKQAFHNLVGPDVSSYIQTLSHFNTGLNEDINPSESASGLLNIIATEHTIRSMSPRFFDGFLRSTLVQGLRILYATKLLTIDTFAEITNRPKSDRLADALIIINRFGLLSTEHCSKVLSNVIPASSPIQIKASECVARSLKILNQHLMLNRTNVQTLLQVDQHQSYSVLAVLEKLGWFTPLFQQAHFEMMLRPDVLPDVSLVITNLKNHSPLDKLLSNLEKSLRSKKREHLFPLIKMMHEKELLDQSIIDWLFNMSSINAIADMSSFLHKIPTDLITKANLETILEWASKAQTLGVYDSKLYIAKCIQFLESLQIAELWTGSCAQTNFDDLINYLTLQIKNSQKGDWYECKTMNQIKTKTIFNGSNHQQKFELLVKTIPSAINVIETILLLEKINLLTTKYSSFLSQSHPYPNLLNRARALELLVNSKCFDENFKQKFYNAMFQVGLPCSYAQAYSKLFTKALYFNDTEQRRVTFDDVKNCPNPSATVQILQCLASHNILTNDHLKIIKRKEKIEFTKIVKEEENEENTSLWPAIDCLKKSTFPLTVVDLEILLSTDHPSPLVIAQVLVKLKRADVPINTDTFNRHFLARILNHITPLDVCDALICLKKLELDEEDYQSYQDAIFNGGTGMIRLSSNPSEMTAAALSTLIKCKTAYALFDGKVYSICNGSQMTVKQLANNRTSCAQLFPRKKNILCSISSENLNIIRTDIGRIEGENSCSSLAEAIAILHNAKSLELPFRSYLPQVLHHLSPIALAKAIVVSNGADYLTPDLFDAMMAHTKPLKLVKAIALLVTNHIEISPISVGAILASQVPLQLAEGIVVLNKESILTDDFMQHHFTRLTSHPTPLAYANALMILHREKLLDEVLNDNKFNPRLETADNQVETYANIIVFCKRHDILKSKLKRKADDFTSNFLTLVHRQPDVSLVLKVLESFEAIEINMEKLKVDGSLVQATLYCDDIDCINEKLVEVIRVATRLNSMSCCKTILITLLKHDSLEKAMKVCEHLYEKKLLTTGTVDALAPTISNKYDAVCVLNRHDLLTQMNLDKLTGPLNHFIALYQSEKLYDENNELAAYYLPIMMEHPHPLDFIRSLSCLQKAGLLIKMNIDQLTQQGDNSSRLQQMLNSDLLSQLTFDCLMRHYSIINASHDLLQRIPDNKFTEAVFCRIIAICQENTINPTAATRRINDYIQHTVLGIARQVPAQLTVTELNTTQSTHTTSVHQSVSASAARLAQRYFIQWRSQSGERCTKEELGNYITQVTKKTYKEIDDYIRHLPESRENSIAQRCWGRLITHGFLNFQDPSSKILTGHLVTLFWTAVHDLAIRNYNKKDLKATVIEEGRALFTRALYEIQRDGNINEQDLDDEADEDKVPSCAAGTFNKFIEKLNTVHPDVELIVTTRTGAINRFQILVKQHCFETMKQQINEAKKKGEVLAPETIENAIEQLWPTIQPIVSDLLFKEYGSIYMNNTQNADFTALIQLGPEVTFTEEQVQALQQLNTPVAAGKKHQREEEEEETAAAEEQISAIVDHGFFAQKPNDQNDKQPPAGQAPGFD